MNYSGAASLRMLPPHPERSPPRPTWGPQRWGWGLVPLVVCRPPRRDAPCERERDETCNLPEHGVMLSMRERSPCKASFHFIERRRGGKGGGERTSTRAGPDPVSSLFYSLFSCSASSHPPLFSNGCSIHAGSARCHPAGMGLCWGEPQYGPQLITTLSRCWDPRRVWGPASGLAVRWRAVQRRGPFPEMLLGWGWR